LLNKLPPAENGLKEKLPIPTLISNGSPEDSMTSTTVLSNSTFQDVKPTNFSLCNSKNIKTLLMLLISSELNLPEVKPPEKLQSLLKLMVNTPPNLLNTNICSKLKLLTNSSNKFNLKVLTFHKTHKLLMTSLILTTPLPEESKKIILTTPLVYLTLNPSNPPLIPPTLLVISTKELEPCSTDSKTILPKVLPLLKKTKSKPLSIPPNIKSKPPLKLLDYTSMLKKEKLTSSNLPLTSKLL